MVDYTESFLEKIVAVHWPGAGAIAIFHMMASEFAHILTDFVEKVRLVLPDGTVVDPWSIPTLLDTSAMDTADVNHRYWGSNLGPGFESGTDTGRAPGLISLSMRGRDQFVFVNLSKFTAVNGRYTFKFRIPAYTPVNENVTWFVAWDSSGPAVAVGPPTKYTANLIGAGGIPVVIYDQLAAFNALIAAGSPGNLMCGNVFESEADALAFASAHGLVGFYVLTEMKLNNSVSSAGLNIFNVGAYKANGFAYPPGYSDGIPYHFPLLTNTDTGASWITGFTIEEDGDLFLSAPQGYLPGGRDPDGGDFGFEATYGFSTTVFNSSQIDRQVYFDTKTFILHRGTP